MNTHRLADYYERMLLIRCFEATLERLFQHGAASGTMHSCAGQEAVAVGVVEALGPQDVLTGHHRSHGHYLARTDDVEGLLAEILGRPEGVVGGRGGSQHLCGQGFYSNGVQGSMVPVAVGMALAARRQGSDGLAVCFIGDGTLGEGVLYESLNLAALWRLPVLFVVENNHYAMSTRVSEAVAGTIEARAAAFGIATRRSSGNDVCDVATKAEETVGTMRTRPEPCFWVLDTYRLAGHSRSDACAYRSREEEAHWRAQDPLTLAEVSLSAEAIEAAQQRVRSRLKQALRQVCGDAPAAVVAMDDAERVVS